MKTNRTHEYFSKKFGQYFDWVNGGLPGADYYVSDRTWYNMPIFHFHRKVNGVYLSGGEWLMNRREYVYGGDTQSIFRTGYGLAFKGRTKVNIANNSSLSDAQLLEDFAATKLKGAEAWDKLKPAQPDFSAAVSLAELREIPGSLKFRLRDIKETIARRKAGGSFFSPKGTSFNRTVASSGKKTRGGDSYANIIGNSYLAYVFGFLPLAKDIRDFFEVFNSKKKILDQLIRDNGRPVKRQCSITSPPDSSTSNTYPKGGTTGHNADISPVFVTQCYVPGYNHLVFTKVDTSVEYKTWAEGKFRYMLPPGPRNGPWRRRMYRRIMGLRVTPEVLYNLIPWSWLADYFTDLGHFVGAVSGGVEENLYAEYAYIMRTITRKTTYTCTENVRGNKAGNGVTKVSTLVITDVTKIRVQATPFGFGFSEENLTPKQTAVMGALGLSKL